MTAAHVAMKMDRNARSPGSSRGVRRGRRVRDRCASRVIPALRRPATASGGRGHSPRPAARCRQSRAADAAALANQRSTSWIPRRFSGASGRGRRCRCSSANSWGRRRDRGRAPGRVRRGQLPGRRRGRVRGAPRAQPAGRVGKDEVEEERKAKPAASVPRLRTSGGPLLPAGPKRPEPCNPCKQSRRLSTQPAGRGMQRGRPHESKTGEDGEDGSEVGATGIGRELAWAARDGERAQTAPPRRRAERSSPDERGRAPPADCRTSYDPDIVAGHKPTLGPATMSPGQRSS